MRALNTTQQWTTRLMLSIDQRVQFSTSFLRNTGQYAGNDAPTSKGPFARGTVTKLEPVGAKNALVSVTWDNGVRSNVLMSNLKGI